MDTIPTTPQPWDRQRDGDGKLEPMRWYARYLRYQDAGPGRSLLDCVNAERVQNGTKKYPGVPGAWTKAFDRWHWRSRAEAWDVAQRAKYEAELEEARLQAIADQREDARLMREKGRAILDTLPLVKQRGKGDDGGLIEIAPASSSEYRAAGDLLDKAAKLEAARLGLPTEVQRIAPTDPTGQKEYQGDVYAALLAHLQTRMAEDDGA